LIAVAGFNVAVGYTTPKKVFVDLMLLDPVS